MRARVAIACLLGLLCVPALAFAAGFVGTKTLTTTMTGKNEVPKGARQGSGKAVFTLDASKGKVCWKFSSIKGISKVTASHIHKGAKGTSGNVVVPLFTGALKMKGCVKAAKSLITAIEKHPAGYYANIHTVKYPAGAIRGAL
jgi:hypothetical protein